MSAGDGGGRAGATQGGLLERSVIRAALVALTLAVASCPRPRGEATHDPVWKVVFAGTDAAAAGVVVTRIGPGAARAEHVVGADGRVPIAAGTRAVTIVDPRSGLTLYEGALPAGGALAVPRPLRVVGRLSGFTAPAVYLGTGPGLSGNEHHARAHGMPWPARPATDAFGPIAARWAPVVLTGETFERWIPAGGVVQLAVRGEASAAVRYVRIPDTAAPWATIDVGAVTPDPTGAIEVRIGRAGQTAAPALFVSVDETAPMTDDQRRHALLLHAVDPDRELFFTGRRALEIPADGVLRVDGVRAPGMVTVTLTSRGMGAPLRRALAVKPGEVATWQVAAAELVSHPAAKNGATAAPPGVAALPGICQNASNWTTTPQFTGVPGGQAFDAVLAPYYQTLDEGWFQVPDDAFAINSLHILRCSSSDCKTVGGAAITRQLPSNWSGLVEILVQYSPFLIGLGGEQKVSVNTQFEFAAAVGSQLDPGMLVERLSVYVVDSSGNPLRDANVYFPAQIAALDPYEDVTGSDGKLRLQCVNSPDSPYGGGMSIFLREQDQIFDNACDRYTAQAGTQACLVIQTAPDTGQVGAAGVCSPKGSSCTP